MELCRSKQTPYPKDEQVNISPVLFRIVDFANTAANLHLHENHNKKKRWRGMRLHFPDINGTEYMISKYMIIFNIIQSVYDYIQDTTSKIEG